MKLRVQDVVRNFFPLQHSAEQLRRFHAHRADQDRLLLGVAFFDLVDDGVVFLAARFVDAIVRILARHRPVRRDDVDVELVDVVKLGRFGVGGAGHAGEFVVEPEIILDRDRRERLRLAIDLHAFLRFDRLVQPVAPAAPRHFAAGVFIDDDDFVFLDDVGDVLSRKGSRRAVVARCCESAPPARRKAVAVPSSGGLCRPAKWPDRDRSR